MKYCEYKYSFWKNRLGTKEFQNMIVRQGWVFADRVSLIKYFRPPTKLKINYIYTLYQAMCLCTVGELR